MRSRKSVWISSPARRDSTDRQLGVIGHQLVPPHQYHAAHHDPSDSHGAGKARSPRVQPLRKSTPRRLIQGPGSATVVVLAPGHQESRVHNPSAAVRTMEPSPAHARPGHRGVQPLHCSSQLDSVQPLETTPDAHSKANHGDVGSALPLAHLLRT